MLGHWLGHMCAMLWCDPDFPFNLAIVIRPFQSCLAYTCILKTVSCKELIHDRDTALMLALSVVTLTIKTFPGQNLRNCR